MCIITTAIAFFEGIWVCIPRPVVCPLDCIYLRVEQSVCVVSVGRSLVESVVAAARVVHVRVAQRRGEDGAEEAEDPQTRRIPHLLPHTTSFLSRVGSIKEGAQLEAEKVRKEQ